jgi:hypothetical protein
MQWHCLLIKKKGNRVNYTGVNGHVIASPSPPEQMGTESPRAKMADLYKTWANALLLNAKGLFGRDSPASDSPKPDLDPLLFDKHF